MKRPPRTTTSKELLPYGADAVPKLGTPMDLVHLLRITAKTPGLPLKLRRWAVQQILDGLFLLRGHGEYGDWPDGERLLYQIVSWGLRGTSLESLGRDMKRAHGHLEPKDRA